MSDLILTSQKLVDKTRKGKLRPWSSKKKDNTLYAKYLAQLHFNKADNVRTMW